MNKYDNASGVFTLFGMLLVITGCIFKFGWLGAIATGFGLVAIGIAIAYQGLKK